jgi:hypothetical protein
MSSFLAGIALRGAGLYPVARTRTPQPGTAEAVLTELSAERTVPSPIAAVASEAREQRAESPSFRQMTAAIDVRTEVAPSATEPLSPSTTPIQSAPVLTPVPAPGERIERQLHIELPSHAEPVERERPVHLRRDSGVAAIDDRVSAEATHQPHRDQLLTRDVPLRPTMTEATPLPLPYSGKSIAAPDPEPRPVEVRIGSIEVRAAAPPAKPASAPVAKPASTAADFESFARVRTYRRGL